ncbi:response regulator transcription factor [Clostridia bacterium]|nr:response regulator transcription factor [Clostridia bacterium]
MSKRVLYADDEPRFRKLVKDYLTKEGFTVTDVKDGKEALEALTYQSFDLVILDVMMPGYDGWAVLREIRKTMTMPVIMLTARDEESDELFGFELGADEYVAKPFSPKVLVARIQSLLKRGKDRMSEHLEYAGIRLDRDSHRVFLHDTELVMSPKEYDLLAFFMENVNIAISRERLLDVVWGYDYYGDLRTVDTHIKRLRSKLDDKSMLIQTVRGVGYRFGENN